MNDVQTSLAKCFSAVFPGLTAQEIASASMETVGTWDSVATVTLIAVIEEEFGIQIEPEALERLVSFCSILDYLTELSAPR